MNKANNSFCNGYVNLAIAMIKDGMKHGDIDFFESEWGEVVFELANIKHNLSLPKIKEYAREQRSRVNPTPFEVDIFDLL